jgi:hypothetical protein
MNNNTRTDVRKQFPLKESAQSQSDKTYKLDSQGMVQEFLVTLTECQSVNISSIQ